MHIISIILVLALHYFVRACVCASACMYHVGSYNDKTLFYQGIVEKQLLLADEHVTLNKYI